MPKPSKNSKSKKKTSPTSERIVPYGSQKALDSEDMAVPSSVRLSIMKNDDDKANYERYMQLIDADEDLTLSILEADRIALMFTMVDRFKGWELALERDEWVRILTKNMSIAQLMQKYEMYAMDYIAKKKIKFGGMESPFDTAKELVMKLRQGASEFELHWKAQETDSQGVMVVDANKEQAESREDSVPSIEGVAEPEFGSPAPQTKGKKEKRVR